MSKNEKIKKIINFKYIKKGKDTLQKKAVKALFAFLVLMIGCTMLSRAADSMTIPRIKVDTPKSKTIVDEVKAKGVVAKNREEKISVVEGLKIDYVNISVGSSIKVGDTLVELDKDDLQAKVDEIKKNDPNLAYPKDVKAHMNTCYSLDDNMISCNITYDIYFDNYIKSVCDELDNDRMFFPYTGYTGYCENEYIRNTNYFEMKRVNNTYKLNRVTNKLNDK